MLKIQLYITIIKCIVKYSLLENSYFNKCSRDKYKLLFSTAFNVLLKYIYTLLFNSIVHIFAKIFFKIKSHPGAFGIFLNDDASKSMSFEQLIKT